MPHKASLNKKSVAEVKKTASATIAHSMRRSRIKICDFLIFIITFIDFERKGWLTDNRVNIR